MIAYYIVSGSQIKVFHYTLKIIKMIKMISIIHRIIYTITVYLTWYAYHIGMVVTHYLSCISHCLRSSLKSFVIETVSNCLALQHSQSYVFDL